MPLLRIHPSFRSVVRASAVIALAGSAAACTPEARLAPQDVATATFASSLGINLAAMTKTTGGAYYQDVSIGNGTTAVTGSHLTVNYTGYLTNGTSFDTSIGKSPFGFTLGQGQVIQGWDEGLVGMRVGGTRKLVIPPSLGYGATGVGSIPGNSILVFTVSLVSIP